MSKLARLSAPLIAVAMLATPAMAGWYDRNGSAIDPSRVVHCIRAPDVGQFAGGPYANAPCEPAYWRSGSGRHSNTASYTGSTGRRSSLVGGADPGTYKP